MFRINILRNGRLFPLNLASGAISFPTSAINKPSPLSDDRWPFLWCSRPFLTFELDLFDLLHGEFQLFWALFWKPRGWRTSSPALSSLPMNSALGDSFRDIQIVIWNIAKTTYEGKYRQKVIGHEPGAKHKLGSAVHPFPSAALPKD